MKKSFTFAFTLFFHILFFSHVNALPVFAQNLGLDCTQCHTAYGQLTEFGKLFLQTGGELLVQKKYGNVSMTPFPFAGKIHSLVDKQFSTDSRHHQTRADRELELLGVAEANIFMAGTVGKVFYWAEFSAATDDDFDMGFEEGFINYRVCDNFHVFFGYTSPVRIDGNNTVFHDNVLERNWKAADYSPDFDTQFLGVYRKLHNFDFIASWMADIEQVDGIDPRGFTLRAAYNIGKQTIGAYFLRGVSFDEECDKSKYAFYRYGIDAHFRFDHANIMMLLGFRNEYHEKFDFDFSVEANRIYTVKNKCLSKWITSFIPIVNLDLFQDRTLSSGTWLQGSGGVAIYVNPACRIFPQVIATFIAPSKYRHKDFQLLISADTVF